MQEIAAYLLLKLAGKDGSSDEITAVIEAAGGSADESALSTLLGDLEGKDVNELLAAGMDKLKDVKMGGGGGGAGGAAGGDAAEEEEEEEKVEEEEIDMGGSMSMFGDDEGGDDY
eukprot:CAMPEP_0178947044 /NCGR_PEP_ID=MMETSP0789-20121207/4620_1 /TAXON_ID=3005 /ORGANISM="Rhizosolenia setigera, Strain CCMP 1694" /LENGTH=114 /DNA_ID=CAMNT_0020627099 /DNA_START=109 /DNA_END=453 /DNA_ORIENTATION=-